MIFHSDIYFVRIFSFENMLYVIEYTSLEILKIFIN